MREITEIIIHCSYTPASMDIGADEIRVWHMDKGWRDIGYHYVIRRDGTREIGRPESVVGAHAKGHNKNAIGICMVGGKSDSGNRAECNFSRHQWRELDLLVTQMQMKYPDAKVYGHRDFSTKSCPTFHVDKWLA